MTNGKCSMLAPRYLQLLLRGSLLCAFVLATQLVSAESNPLVRLERTPDGGLQPQVAVEPGGRVHLVFLKGDPKACNVFYCWRKPGGTNFSKPIRVNSEPGSAIAIGTVRGAQIALGRESSDGFQVHVVWNGAQPARDPGAKGVPMLYSRLASTRSEFEPQRNLMTSTMNLDGGGSVAADLRGNVYAVWHAHPQTGPDDELHRGVYVSRSTNDGKTFAPEHKANPEGVGVCGCCGLKAFADRQGNLAILYRSADESANRDSLLLVSTNLGLAFESLPLGAWRSSTCPMSTPALGTGPQHSILAMWESQGQVYQRAIAVPQLSSSLPAMTPGENPGNRKHPTFAINQAKRPRLLLAWLEATGWEKGGSVAWECVDLLDHTTTSGREPGVPAWDLAAAFPEPDGTFTILY
jgi:hypothetical protein